MKSNQNETTTILNQMLKENRGRITCRFCFMRLPNHLDSCALHKIDPIKLLRWKQEAAQELRDNANKQRIFKNDPHIRKGPPQGGARRHPGTKPKPQDGREMKWCGSCDAMRVSHFNGQSWQCMRCESEQSGS